jgi:hypothetical protein
VPTSKICAPIKWAKHSCFEIGGGCEIVSESFGEKMVEFSNSSIELIYFFEKYLA